MNPSGGDANQQFGDNNDVDLLIGVSHGNIYYNSTKVPTAAELLESGKLYLSSGIVDTARSRIEEAIKEGLRGGEVCFYYVLALLSGRSLEKLSEGERQRLKTAESLLLRHESGRAADLAARLVLDLVDLDADGRDDVDALFDRLDQAGEQWRRAIVRHLEFVLNGRAKDGLWGRSVKQAQVDQMAGERESRAWKFFHPEPARPARAPIREARTDAPAIVALVASSLVTVTFLLQLVTGVLGYFLVAVGPIAAATCVFLICDRAAHRHVRLRLSVLDTPFGAPPAHLAGPIGMYCKRYAKDHPDLKGWMDATQPIRDAVAWELDQTYPENGLFHTGPIRWLIRHRAQQIVGVGACTGPALPAQAPLGTWMGIAGSGLAVVTAGLLLLSDALNESFGRTLLVVPVIALFGYLSVRLGLGVLGRQRETFYLRKRADEEYERSRDYFAYWQDKLADRPSEGEMAEWLGADRILFINRALDHYKLEPRRVTSHAILESPANARQAHSRARVADGPWRHQHYDLTMFLLSGDGIRQVMTRLDFARGELSNDARENFRYDTICSFRVESTPGDGRTLRLRRMDGNSDEYVIVASDETTGVRDEAAEISAEAAGLDQTIHLLEGIAAEGKTWIAAGVSAV